MFLTKEELKTVIYDYQLAEIIEGDDTIAEMAIAAAVEEIKSYITTKYDTNAIFSASGSARNPLILELCKDVAMWHIIRLSNPDILFEPVKDRYDRAISYLDKIATGKVTPELPVFPDGPNGDGSNSLFKFGSIDKQSYDY